MPAPPLRSASRQARPVLLAHSVRVRCPTASRKGGFQTRGGWRALYARYLRKRASARFVALADVRRTIGSEQHFQANLIYSARAGACDLPELLICNVVIRPPPLGMVERVERLKPHLHGRAFA